MYRTENEELMAKFAEEPIVKKFTDEGIQLEELIFRARVGTLRKIPGIGFVNELKLKVVLEPFLGYPPPGWHHVKFYSEGNWKSFAQFIEETEIKSLGTKPSEKKELYRWLNAKYEHIMT